MPDTAAVYPELTLVELPPASAAHYFQCIGGLGNRVWLDSGNGPGSHILAAEPLEVIRLDGRTDDFQRLRQLQSRLQPLPSQPGVPFSGGLLGYFSYEINHHRFGLGNRQPHGHFGYFGLYDWALLVDAQSQRARLVFHPACTAAKRQRVQTIVQAGKQLPAAPFRLLTPFVSDQTREQYEASVRRIVEYLEQGDCYQVNLSHAFRASYSGDLTQAWLALRDAFGAPHGALLEFEGEYLMSLSPERFLKVVAKRVETWPIKGTAPRAANPQADRKIARELLQSEKNRAENLMIVDLMRNDLSQVCRAGSIHAPQLNQLHSFALVHHLVSCVTGELADDKDLFDLYAACLPGGSITGAPKRRAMQIIDELETSPRGPYCGSVAYFSSCGQSDSSIAIRTFRASKGELEMRGGGGVVVDSIPGLEYQETLDKVMGYLALLQQYFTGS